MIKLLKKIKYLNKGSMLLMALLVLTGILSVSLVASNIVIKGLKMSNVQSGSTKAYFASEAGIERTLWEVRKNNFSYPSANKSAVFSWPLSNQSDYVIDYATSSPYVYFISSGKYKNTNRSVKIGYLFSGPPPACVETCSGDVGCNFIDPDPGNTIVGSGNCCGSDVCYECNTGLAWDGVQCGNYIVIDDCAELQEISYNVLYPSDGDYLLSQDIDCSATSGWNGGDGFIPIGSGNNFTGTFNGNYKAINDIYINKSSGSRYGVFGEINGAVIKNLGIENIDLTAAHYVGGLVGESYNSNVINCYVTGVVVGDTRVGGLVGLQYTNSSVTSSFFSGDVTATDTQVGGLVGNNLVNSTVSSSYALGTVTGDTVVGGLVGNEMANINLSFSFNSIIGNSNIGGFVGQKAGGSISSSYWDTDKSGLIVACGNIICTGVVGKTTTEMIQQITYGGWDFVSTWNIDEGISYPCHVWWTDLGNSCFTP